ncbi:phosphotransferase family protein [Curtobacterium sp. MWU13-2055]|uniref:phosphotransferase family protein n=1 Tax=Curtobacterium sp. MWU13-2055 TaxID=2931928 RepID=UPI00200D8CCB|nr:aminoglycoside phosphotransferase family protein [Curtobacterium sp. MWU13-2055]
MTGQRCGVLGGVERERAERVLDTINADERWLWVIAGRPDGGEQGGAWYVEGVDGRTAVLKISDPSWAEQMLLAEEAVGMVRRAGYPTPAWIRCGRTADGIGYQLQERVPGARLTSVDVGGARALISTIDLQAGLNPAPGRNWNDFVVDQLTRDMGNLCSASATAGASGMALVEMCRRLADDVDARDWPCSDMVHGDFRPANVLLMNGEVTGVVDVEAIGSGTRAFDFATLLSYGPIDGDAVELIVNAGSLAGGEQALRACVALVFLDLVRFAAARPDATPETTAFEGARLVERAAMVEALTNR